MKKLIVVKNLLYRYINTISMTSSFFNIISLHIQANCVLVVLVMFVFLCLFKVVVMVMFICLLNVIIVIMFIFLCLFKVIIIITNL
jgi:hypothetical protein